MNDALFAELTSDDRAALFAHAQEISCSAGETILREGEAGTKLFLIDDGAVAITRKHGEVTELLNVLTKGEYFGEMALLTIEPRSATARAIEPCRFTVLAHDDFQRFVKLHPQVGAIVYRNFAMTLSLRLQRMTAKFDYMHPRASLPAAAQSMPVPPQEGDARLLTPAILIKGIIELLQDRSLDAKKRTYFEAVVRAQLQTLAQCLDPV